MTEEPLRVLIADDHPVFRDGLRGVLDTMGTAEVVAEAATGTDAVQAAAALQPDVVVMDLHMPELGGIEATRRIVGASPHIAVLVLTMSEDDDSVFAAMQAGARGYLVKGAGSADIVRAVRSVASGDAIFGPGIAERVLRFFAAARSSAQPPAFPSLTDREREVLELVARGDGNATIAHKLAVSQKTVRNHVSNIFLKLQVADRAQAIVRARQAGFGQSIPGSDPP
jgi:DNA-binding NarL/FixJ family response regulator